MFVICMISKKGLSCCEKIHGSPPKVYKPFPNMTAFRSVQKARGKKNFLGLQNRESWFMQYS